MRPPNKNAHVFTEVYKTAYKAHLDAMMPKPMGLIGRPTRDQKANIRKLVLDAFNAGWIAAGKKMPS